MGLILSTVACPAVDCVWKVMAHAQKPDFVFRRNGRVHLNRRGRQFSRLLAAEVWPSAVVMLDTQCSELVWRALATHSIRQFPLHFPSRASVCHHISTGLYHTFSTLSHKGMVQMAIPSKVWVCGRSPAAIEGSNPTGGMDVCLL